MTSVSIFKAAGVAVYSFLAGSCLGLAADAESAGKDVAKDCVRGAGLCLQGTAPPPNATLCIPDGAVPCCAPNVCAPVPGGYACTSPPGDAGAKP
jgi:hypothetical protein